MADDVIKYITGNTPNEGGMTIYTNVTGNPTNVSLSLPDSPCAYSGILADRFDEIRYYTNDV